MGGLSTWASQNELEEAVGLMLHVLQNYGDVLDKYHLLRARDYPDFWARDRKGRQYLVECKNGIPRPVPKPRHFSDNGRWVEEYRWTESHILAKAWNLPRYETRPERGAKHGTWIEVNHPLPILVIRHMNFDMQSLKALRDLFNPNPLAQIICFGKANPEKARWDYIFQRLRELFAHKEPNGDFTA